MPKKELTHQTIKAMGKPEKPIAYFDKNFKGLILRLSKAGTKTFCYRYRFSGKNKRFTIGKFPDISLSEARKRVGGLRQKVKDGIDPQKEKKKRKDQPDPQTFRELANEFKEKYLPTLRESTQKEYRRIIDVELIPKLGKYPINDISKNQIINLLDDKAYKNDAPTMANRIRARLSKIYSFGIQRNLADSNPVQNTATYKKGNAKRDRYYDESEIRILWQWFEQFEQPTQAVFKMLLITGQRKTETMKMRWDNIKDDVWTIPAKLAKNKKPHDVPLSDIALQIIDEMRPITYKTDYVFCSPQKDNTPIAWLSRARRTIQKHSEVSDFRPHDLRRTVATHMAKLAVGRTVLGKILNHKGLSGDSQVTAIYDRHSYMKEKRQAMNRWSNHLRGILADKSEAEIERQANQS